MEDFKFETKVLKWARIRGLGPKMETLASKLQTSSSSLTLEAVTKWEAGQSNPDFSEVKKLAEIYKRPLAVFFLDSPPEELDAPPDCRSMGSKTNSNISPKGLLIIRKARKIQAISAALYEELGEKHPFKYKKYTIDTDPEVLAEQIRADLDINLQSQFKSKKFEDFFEYLRNKIEDTGVITLKSGSSDSVPKEDYRAFSFADKEPYIILINNNDYEGAKNFSLAHEFAHILLRQAGLCNNFQSFNYNGSKIDQLEVFCNKFAANLLVPKNDFLNHTLLKGRTKIVAQDLEQIVNRLTLNFKVSRVVILRRLLTFDFINDSTYNDKIEVWDKTILPPRKKGGSFSFKTILDKNGKAYSTLIFETYGKGKIAYSSVAEYLNIKGSHVSKFKDYLHSYEP